MWTYMIVALVLLGAVLLVNVVLSNPTNAKHALDKVFGLPGWALAAILGAVGALIFYMGLKVEADWPEHMGAFMIAGAVTWGEILFGWHRLEIGGLVVIPYLFPPLILIVLYIITLKYSE
jgi:hypothetical protein